MNKDQVKELIEAVLKEMNLYSEEAVDLLMLTSAQESHLGEYIKQIGGGPALGIFQMEPTTMFDIFYNYLDYRSSIRKKASVYVSPKGFKFNLHSNLAFQIAIARIHYLRVPEAIPKLKNNHHTDKYYRELARYWKTYWNTDQGAGTVQEAYENYLRYCI